MSLGEASVPFRHFCHEPHKTTLKNEVCSKKGPSSARGPVEKTGQRAGDTVWEGPSHGVESHPPTPTWADLPRCPGGLDTRTHVGPVTPGQTWEGPCNTHAGAGTGTPDPRQEKSFRSPRGRTWRTVDRREAWSRCGRQHTGSREEGAPGGPVRSSRGNLLLLPSTLRPTNKRMFDISRHSGSGPSCSE